MVGPSRSPGATTVLTCGDPARRRWSDALRAALEAPGTADVALVGVGATPTRAEVDPLLDGSTRLVVAGDDAALAAVLVRLLRRERLDVALALLPAGESEAATVWGLAAATDVSTAVPVALSAPAHAVPLVRDDRGGVVIGSHRLGAFHGEVYCDAERLVRGDAAGLVVRPDPERAGLAVTVTGPRRLGGLRPGPVRAARGRAVQVGCRPVTVVREGVGEDRPIERRSWYRHVEDWHLVRP